LNRIKDKTFKNGMRYDFEYESLTHAVNKIRITGSPNAETAANFTYDDFGDMTQKKVTRTNLPDLTTNYFFDSSKRLRNSFTRLLVKHLLKLMHHQTIT
jgi:hypothetical protein